MLDKIGNTCRAYRSSTKANAAKANAAKAKAGLANAVPGQKRIGQPLGRRGATALEFAILAFPFFLLLLFLFELGLDFYVQLALDYAVQEGARKLQTGAGNAATSADVFKNDCMCPPVAAFLNCGQLTLNVFPVPNTVAGSGGSGTGDFYSNAQAGAGSLPINDGTLSTSTWNLAAGAPNQLMFMQAIYTSVSVVGLLLPQMSAISGSGRVHVTSSSIGFINEPFTAGTQVCGVTQ
jgi:Flp pilus assembly protein TadG